MSHFAEIGGLSAFTLTTEVSSTLGTITETLTGYQATVLRVIVAEQDFINAGYVGDSKNWIQCSYTGRIRNMYPGPGMLYESIRDIFYPSSPYPSWVLNKTPIEGLDENNNIIISNYLYKWDAPVSRPKDNKNYTWNESTTAWDVVTNNNV